MLKSEFNQSVRLAVLLIEVKEHQRILSERIDALEQEIIFLKIPKWKTALKCAIMFLYCWHVLPKRIIMFVFRNCDLRSA